MFMVKAFFWTLVILCLLFLIYGLGSLLKRKSDGEDVKPDTIASFAFSGLTFILSLVMFFLEDTIKPPIEETTVPTVSVLQTTPPTQPPTTTTLPVEPSSTTTATQPIGASPKGYIQLQGDTITGAVSSKDAVLIQPYKAAKSGRYRFDFNISDVTNKYRVIIKDSNNKKIEDEYSSSSGTSGITCNLNAEEEYQIIVTPVQYENEFIFEIKINIPDN